MNSVQLKTFNRAGIHKSRVIKHYISEPYSLLMHYKRTFKFLKGMEGTSALVLGNKNMTAINWKEAVVKIDSQATPEVNKGFLAIAPTVYSLIICLDPVLFARHLRNYPLPIIGVATPAEIHEYPEILEIIDYLIPATTQRSDVTIRNIVWNQIINDKQTTENK